MLHSHAETYIEDWVDPAHPNSAIPTCCKVFPTANSEAFLETYLHKLASEGSAGVVKFYQQFYVNETIAMRVEHCPNGSLSAEILKRAKEHSPFEEECMVRVAQSVLATLVDLYAVRVAHRSIDPTNFVLTAGNDVKLTGFETAKLVQDSDTVDRHTVRGQVAYTSPESKQLWDKGQSGALDVFKNDLWGAGKVLLEMASLKVYEFLNTRQGSLLQDSVTATLHSTGHPRLVNTLTAMLRCDDRCTAEEALAILSTDLQTVPREPLSETTTVNNQESGLKPVVEQCEVSPQKKGGTVQTYRQVSICSKCVLAPHESGRVQLTLCLDCSKLALII